MHVTERIIGFDIRYNSHDAFLNNTIPKYPQIKRLCSYDATAWNSRFREGTLEEDKLLDTTKLNFRKPHDKINDKMIVRTEYSYHYSIMKIWENLGNMLCRYSPNPVSDSVVAFSFMLITSPEIYCRKSSIFDDNWGDIYNLKDANATPDGLNHEEWRMLGYDVGESKGYSFLYYADNSIAGQPTIKEKLAKNEGYQLGVNRNRFGLLNDLETAVHECILMNAYHDDCPFFVFGVYEAIDINKLSFV